jgi:hypothetical protein
VLRQSRRDASLVKRAKVLSALDAMKAAGEPVTFASVARTAGVSRWLVYAEGVREHVEAAMKSQARTGRRQTAAGKGASAASLATDLELVRRENRALRAEVATLRKAVRQKLGAQVEAAGTQESQERIGELLGQLERAQAERDAALAEAAELRVRVAEAEENMQAAMTASRELMRRANRGG